MSAPTGPRPVAPERAALNAILRSLNDVRAASTLQTPQPTYANRVSVLVADAARFLASTPAPPARDDVRDIVEVYRLAGDAWTAKVRDDVALLETVGADRAVALCPAVAAAADAATPSDVSRAHARGVAVASAIPTLWACGAERLGALEARLEH
jgi:hypothetical protein